jgi:hypothetical protein
MLWKKLGKIIGKLRKLINYKLTPTLRLEHNKFEHNGPQISFHRTCWKTYDGANIPRWNLEVEPFVA